MAASTTRLVLTVGTAQTLSWASSYYLPAILATPIARELGLAVAEVYAAFSLAMVVSALVGPRAGRLIDRHGGRPVLIGTSLLFAAALGWLGCATSSLSLFAAWALLGVAMGGGLYDAAFAALVHLRGRGARGAITGITLLAGFASTVGWPVSTWLMQNFGWREACWTWALLHLLIGLPLYASLARSSRTVEALADAAIHTRTNGREVPAAVTPGHGVTAGGATGAGGAGGADGAAASAAARAARPLQSDVVRMGLLAYVFAATWFCSTAIAVHLPMLLVATGMTLAAAVGVGALIGPAQVAGRLLEFVGLRRVHPLVTARCAACTHPLAVLALLGLGPVAAPLFAVVHGAGNGILTIAKGTLPLALFGPQNYGQRQGWLTMPARFTQALAPFAFGLALQTWGLASLWLTGAVGLSAALALLALRK